MWMTTMQKPSRSMDYNNGVTGGDNHLNREPVQSMTWLIETHSESSRVCLTELTLFIRKNYYQNVHPHLLWACAFCYKSDLIVA